MANITAPVSPQNTHHQYPSRIKSFCRQNQNNFRRRTLIPIMYLILGCCYIYGLLFRHISTKTLYASQDGSISDIPSDNSVLIEPQSLSHVAISNAETIWKKREQREEYLKRRAARIKEMKKNVTRVMTHDDNQTTFIIIRDPERSLVTNSSNVPNTTRSKYDSSLHIPRRYPTPRKIRGTSTSSTPTKNHDAAIPLMLIITFCTLFRVCFSLALNRITDDDEDEQNPASGEGSNTAFWTRRQLRRRARTQIRQRQFQNFVDRLNAQRVENGERPIGADSLRLVVSDRDFNGNDYERLWQFHEENGPAMGSLFSSIGATEAEIGRCPERTLVEGDDLVGRSCSVCLEVYAVGDRVRTIPCFHTFHTGCIDPWLVERAECPICKHSAIG